MNALAVESFPQAGSRTVTLTPREVEVLSLIAEGKKRKEAANALIVSKRTVDSHLENIFGKFGVHSRNDACEVAKKLAIIPNTFGLA